MNFPQITDLVHQGFSPEQISETLQQPLEVVKKVIENNFKEEEETVDSLYAKHQISAIKVLASVMRDSENDSARVTAAKVLLTRGGSFTEDTMIRLSDRFSRMREVCKKHSLSYAATLTSGEEDYNDVKIELNGLNLSSS